jgi:Flp pilus assembly protein TadG
MKKIFRVHKSGQTLVEFALTLPLLALLLFAIIQYGFIFSAYMTLRHGAHVAARTASLPGGASDIQAVYCSAVSPLLDCARLGTAVVTSNTVGTLSAVTVSNSYSLPLIIRFVVPGATGNALTISAQATYRTS